MLCTTCTENIPFSLVGHVKRPPGRRSSLSRETRKAPAEMSVLVHRWRSLWGLGFFFASKFQNKKQNPKRKSERRLLLIGFVEREPFFDDTTPEGFKGLNRWAKWTPVQASLNLATEFSFFSTMLSSPAMAPVFSLYPSYVISFPLGWDSLGSLASRGQKRMHARLLSYGLLTDAYRELI